MKKIGLLCLALVLALGTLGLGYATWSDNVTVEEHIESSEMCVSLTSCSTNDGGMQDDQTIGTIVPTCANTHNTTLCDVAAGKYGQITPNSRACPLGKHVGSSNCTMVDRNGDGQLEVMLIDAYNQYPSYYGIANFSACNCGPLPWAILDVDVVVNDVVVGTYDANFCQTYDLDGDTVPDLEIWWGDSFGCQKDQWQCVDISVHWHLLQEAPQDAELEVKMVINVVQWNMHPDIRDCD
jgi:hypothetical protein